MHKKKVFVLLVACMCIGVLLISCGNGNNSEEKPKKVAVLIHNMQATYASWLAQSFEKYDQDYVGFEVTIFDGKDQLATQISQLETAVANGYSMIWVQAVDSIAMFEHMNSAIDQGVPVGAVNGTNLPGAPRASVVDADPVEQGSVSAQVAVEKLPQNAKVVVLLGPAGNFHSNGRRVGYQQTLFDVRPDIEILDEQIANWMKGEAMNLMENWLEKYPQIDGVIAMNDSMAIGALEAARAVGRDSHMTSYGVDGLADAVLSIQDNGLTATCVQNADDQAFQALKITKGVLSGDIEQDSVMSKGVLVTLDNVDEWIKIHTENGQIR